MTLNQPQEAPVATTSKQYLHPLESAKAYVALVGAIATALLGVFATDTTVGQVLLVISVVATAVATYKVPNADAPAQDEHDDFDYPEDEDAFVDGHGGPGVV